MTLKDWFERYPLTDWTLGYHDGHNCLEYNLAEVKDPLQYALGYDEGRLNDVSYVDLLLGRKRR